MTVFKLPAPTAAGPDTVCKCDHWWEEHEATGAACFAPGCECAQFVFDPFYADSGAIADRGGDSLLWPGWVKERAAAACSGYDPADPKLDECRECGVEKVWHR